jgi:putative PIG3 family NAD(P)H quinone oxidoreductase
MAKTGKLPAKMRAVEITRPGGPEVLVATERPLPRPGPGEVLIRVRAAGVNRPDCFQRMGNYAPPPGVTDIPGLEIAGEIVALGEGAASDLLGQDVTALVAGGGYAQYCTANVGHALPVPEGFSPVQAAAIPETFFTVWHNVFQRGGLKSGETLLVHGGASGIGTTAIQLARAFGAKVVVTAGSDEKCRSCVSLGADVGVNYKTHDFVEAVKTFTSGRGADVILDMVGGDYIDRNYAAAAEEGRIVQIAFLRGAKAHANFAQLMQKRLTHTGSTLRPRSVEFKATLAAALRKEVWPLLGPGRIAPVIDKTFPLERAVDAHSRIEAGEHFGKIILEVA